MALRSFVIAGVQLIGRNRAAGPFEPHPRLTAIGELDARSLERMLQRVEIGRPGRQDPGLKVRHQCHRHHRRSRKIVLRHGDEGASGAMVVETAQDHLLGKGTLVVTQSR